MCLITSRSLTIFSSTRDSNSKYYLRESNIVTLILITYSKNIQWLKNITYIFVNNLHE